MRFIDLKLFLLIFACVGGAVLYESPVRFRTLVETSDPWDIALAGRGFFEVMEPEAGEILYTRTGKLRVDNNGTLCLQVQGKAYSIAPQISIPADWTVFQISSDGQVTIHQNEASTFNIGQIQLASFQAHPAFEDEFLVNRQTDRIGAAVIANPGTNGTGQILQGWLEQPAESTTYRYAKPILIGTVIALVLKVLLDAVIAQQKMQKLLQSQQPPIELQ